MMRDAQIGMEIVECLNKMWKVFSHHISLKDEGAIEEFIEAKDRAHELLSMLSREEPGEIGKHIMILQ